MANEELVINKFKELVEAIKSSNSKSGSSPLDLVGVSDAFVDASPTDAVISNEKLDEILGRIDATADKIALAVNISKLVKDTIDQIADIL